MPKVKLLTVACENRPGTLSYVARVLGDAKINIVAFHCGTIGQNGFVHVVVDNVRKGKKALSAADRKSTRLNSSHVEISYAVFCLKKKMTNRKKSCIVTTSLL